MEAKVVLVEPMKFARVVNTTLTLENMQSTVGGLIQAVYPWEDKVALVCNDEGKLLGLTPNRALADEDGRVYDVVHGTFFICGLGEEDFTGLTDEQAALYLEKFKCPQSFANVDGQLLIVEYHDMGKGG